MEQLEQEQAPSSQFESQAQHSTEYGILAHEGADCVGGHVQIEFAPYGRPRRLGEDLLGFHAALDHGSQSFWINEETTPVWTSNIAYRTAFLRENGLRFVARYNRKGASASDFEGGEDMVMLRWLHDLKAHIRYRPDMTVNHAVEQARLNRCYFLRLHYLAGARIGIHELPDYARRHLGTPTFLYGQGNPPKSQGGHNGAGGTARRAAPGYECDACFRIDYRIPIPHKPARP